MDQVLSKQDALEFDDEEIGELFQVLQYTLNGILGDGVVFAGSEGAGQAMGQKDLSGNLKGSSDYINMG